MNNRTGKRIAETDVDYFLITEAMKEADIVQVSNRTQAPTLVCMLMWGHSIIGRYNLCSMANS